MKEAENKALQVLRTQLGEYGQLSTRRRTDGDLHLRIRVGTGEHSLIAHWVGAGWPNQIRTYLGNRDNWPNTHVFVAREFSRGAIEWLTSRGLNWIDETGHSRIVLPSGLVVVQPAVSTIEGKVASTFAWSPSRIDVAEILLIERRVPRLAELMRLTGWSRTHVSGALLRFDREGWTRKEGSSRGVRAIRRVIDRGGLLEHWAEHVSTEKKRGRLGHVVFRDSIRFLEEELAPALDKLTHDFAASGFAGLQLTSPFLSAAPTLQIYVGQRALGEAVPRLFKQLHVREVSEGPRIEIWPARRASLHGVRPGRNSSVPVVNPYRLYADLLGAGERGRAAAEHLHREVIDRA